LIKSEDFAFKKYLRTKLEKWLNRVLGDQKYNEAAHFKAIEKFSNSVSQKYGHALSKGRLNIGTTQKLLNVYWKANWIFRKGVKEPLHCPFDGIIIKHLTNDVKHMSWTKIDTLKEYKLLVSAAKMKCDKLSLAQWELLKYNQSMFFN
jgi:hypothetical protein